MSLADDAKLLLIPTAYKSGKVYSVFPTNGDGDFTYIRSGDASRVNPGGLIETVGTNIPRIDHTGGGCPTLLLEPQRTNLQVYSEQIDNVVWQKQSDITVTANQTIAPSGEYTADKVQRGSTINTNNYVSDTVNKSSAAQLNISISVFVKQGEGDFFAIRGQGGYSTGRVDFIYQFSTNTITANAAGTDATLLSTKSENYGNGWIRLSFVFNSDANANNSTFFSPRGTSGNIDSSDTSTTAFAYVWGIQVEEGYTTSYIKAEASPTTRLFDDLESDTSYSTVNDVTWFLDFDTYTFENSFRAAMVVRNSGFTQSMDLISYNSGSDYYIRIRATNQSALQTIIAFGEDAIQMFRRNKVAVRLYGSNFEIYVNGTREYTGTSDDGDWTLLNNSAILNDFGTTSERPSTKLYDFRVYDQTMTQSELEELTQV